MKRFCSALCSLAAAGLVACGPSGDSPAPDATTAAPERPSMAKPSPIEAAAPVEEEDDGGRTLVYDCAGDLRFVVRAREDDAEVWIPSSLGGGHAILLPVAAESGTRFAEEDTTYWNRGELADFEVDGRTYEGCRENAAEAPWADAARRGVQFRAIGQEPSWHLEIDETRLVLVMNQGADRYVMPYVRPRTDGARTTYDAAAGDTRMFVTMERRECSDSMSGERFPLSVTVAVDEREYRGCGRPL